VSRRGWKAFVLAGDTSAQAWVKTLLQEELPAQAYGRLLLVPGAKAPVAVQSRGKQVCTCFNVTGPAIDAHLAGCSGTDGERLASLQGTEMRHQLRQLRAGAQTHGESRHSLAQSRVTWEPRCLNPSFAI
jgi:hypothetical protein